MRWTILDLKASVYSVIVRLLSASCYAAPDTARSGSNGVTTILTQGEYGRVWETADTGFDGTLVFHRQRYNIFGQPVEITRPFTDFEGGLTKARFDSLDRPVEIEAPDTSVTAFSYQGLFASTAVDPNGHKTSVLRDVDGRAVTTWDAAGAPTHFGYGPFDQITSVEDPLGNKTSLGYDKLGRRTLLVDPDQGTTTFEHDAFGALRFVRHHLTDAQSPADLVTEYRHDLLGRVYRRLDTYVADPPATDITDYWYDNAPHALGKLIATKSPDGVETAHHYDAQGRPSATEWKIDGQAYSIGRDYDPVTGQLQKLTYPASGAPFRMGFAYNASGWLESVSRLTSPVTASLWRVESRNLDGMLTSAVWHHPGVKESRTYSPLTGRLHHITTKGDAALTDLTYAYDQAGNVVYRRDDVAGRTEDFGYDERDRLVQWKLTVSGGPGAQSSRTTHYGYDDLGNLTQVLEDGALIEKHTIDPAHPHRLTTLTRGGVDRAYFHDARGREQEDSDGRIYTYTPFDLPRHVSRPDPMIPGATATTDFAYDAFGARVKKTTVEGGVVSTTITLGGLYERRERVDLNGVTMQHVHYIPGDGEAVAQIAIDDTTHEETTTYLARDGLGSVSVAFDAKGKEIERYHHEPFGKRIQSDGAPLESFNPKAGVSLGFTGQSMDDDLGLIDMNGRVYDPVQKRFLTPDPFVADPLDSQSYNRYSYVLNNPLRYTDPSGFGPSNWTAPPGIMPVGWVAGKAAEEAAPKPPMAPPPPPPQDKQPPSSDGTGLTPPKPPGAGPPPPPDDTGNGTGRTGPGGPGEGTGKNPDTGNEPKGDEPFWRDNSWIQGAGQLISGLGRVIGIGRNDNGRESDDRKTIGIVVGVGVGSTAVGLGVLVALPAVAIGTVLVKTGVLSTGVGAAGVGAGAGVGVGSGNGTGPLHHIATNKNYIAGGQWSKKFEPIFQEAGLSLKDPRNTVNVPGHYGPHPQEYHQEVLDRLTRDTQGLSGPAYRDALLQTLDQLRVEIQTEGTKLNKLVTGQ